MSKMLISKNQAKFLIRIGGKKMAKGVFAVVIGSKVHQLEKVGGLWFLNDL